MNKITNVKEAIDYIENTVNLSVKDISNLKYHLWDEDMNFFLSSDKELIDYGYPEYHANFLT